MSRISVILSLVFGAVYPALFIWAVNTLFKLGIPFTFKTYLASLVLFLCLRFYFNKTHYHTDYGDDDYYDDYEDEEEEEEEEDDDSNGSPTNGRHLKRVK